MTGCSSRECRSMQYETQTNIVDGQTEHCRVTVLFFLICTTRPKHCVRLVCNGNLRFTIEGEKARGAGEMYLMLLCWRCHADLVGSDILQSSLTHHTHFILPNLPLEGGSHCGIRECQKRNKVRGAYLRKDNFPRRQLFLFVSGSWKPVVVKLFFFSSLLQVLGKDMPRMLGGGRLCVSRHTLLPEMQVPPCGLLSTCRSWHPWTVGSRCTHVWRGFSRRDNHSKCACVTAARRAASIPSTRGVACLGDALRCCTHVASVTLGVMTRWVSAPRDGRVRDGGLV